MNRFCIVRRQEPRLLINPVLPHMERTSSWISPWARYVSGCKAQASHEARGETATATLITNNLKVGASKTRLSWEAMHMNIQL